MANKAAEEELAEISLEQQVRSVNQWAFCLDGCLSRQFLHPPTHNTAPSPHWQSFVYSFDDFFYRKELS